MGKNINKFLDKNNLQEVVKNSYSKREILIKLGINPAGGNFKTLDKYVTYYEFDTSHFKGKGHNKGQVAKNRKDALELCYNGSIVHSHRLKEKLIRDGYKFKKCEKCGIKDWNGEELPFELDHIDGNKYNNELPNLQILCPNCHAIKTRHQEKGKYDGILKIYKEYLSNINKKEIKEPILNKCIICNTETKNKTFCSNRCVEIHKIKNIPSKEKLIDRIKIIGKNFSALGRDFGVSDNAVRKWFLKYDLI